MNTGKQPSELGIRVVDPAAAGPALDLMLARVADPGKSGLAMAALAYPGERLVQRTGPKRT